MIGRDHKLTLRMVLPDALQIQLDLEPLPHQLQRPSPCQSSRYLIELIEIMFCEPRFSLWIRMRMEFRRPRLASGQVDGDPQTRRIAGAWRRQAIRVVRYKSAQFGNRLQRRLEDDLGCFAKRCAMREMTD